MNNTKITTSKNSVKHTSGYSKINGRRSSGNNEPRMKYASAYSDHLSSTLQGIKLCDITDYSEFPLISHYINTYKIHPSTIYYSSTHKYKEFIKKIESIKKSFCFNTTKEMPDTHPASDSTEMYSTFFCFDDIQNEMIFYITISSILYPEKIAAIYKEKGLKEFKIVCAHNPSISARDVFKIVKKKILNLTDVKVTIPKEGELNILTLGSSGYELEPKNISSPDIDFNLNYNEDFIEIDKIVRDKLAIKNSKGLILFHGKPGTGKTTYIRWLINNINGKKIIYIPPNMANSISDPSLIKFRTYPF